MQEETVKKVMEIIEQKRLTPTSRWKFIVKYFALWVFGGISIVSGAIVFSLVLLLFLNGDWAEYRLLHGSFLNAFLKTFPFIWGITFFLFVSVAYVAIRHTKHGYRFHLWAVIGLNIVFSIFFGSILYATGVSDWVDHGLGQCMPGYHSMENTREMRWFHPHLGRIIGTVVQGDSGGKTFLLQDPLGEVWVVLFSDEAKEYSRMMKQGITVGVFGKQISEKKFQAERIKYFPSSGEGKYRKGLEQVKENAGSVRSNN